MPQEISRYLLDMILTGITGVVVGFFMPFLYQQFNLVTKNGLHRFVKKYSNMEEILINKILTNPKYREAALKCIISAEKSFAGYLGEDKNLKKFADARTAIEKMFPDIIGKFAGILIQNVYDEVKEHCAGETNNAN